MVTNDAYKTLQTEDITVTLDQSRPGSVSMKDRPAGPASGGSNVGVKDSQLDTTDPMQDAYNLAGSDS